SPPWPPRDPGAPTGRPRRAPPRARAPRGGSSAVLLRGLLVVRRGLLLRLLRQPAGLARMHQRVHGREPGQVDPLAVRDNRVELAAVEAEDRMARARVEPGGLLAVEVREVHDVAHEGGRARDPARRVEGPADLPRARVERVEGTVVVADDHGRLAARPRS